jgi:quercetin dioxygenase-like cupin family protein
MGSGSSCKHKEADVRAGWVAVTIAAFVGVTGLASAADPLDVAPDMYKKSFENERVRVMTVAFAPGQSIPEHSHPDHFAYVLETGTLKITKSSGEVTEVTPKVGDVVWIPAETHSAVNTGSTPVKLLVVELKP